MTMEEKHAIIEKIAVTLWKKYWSSEYGMTKDLFTLALQDEIVKTLPDCQSQTTSLQSELDKVKEENDKLKESLKFSIKTTVEQKSELEALRKENEELKIELKRAEEYKPEIEEQVKTERVMVIAAELESEYQSRIAELEEQLKDANKQQREVCCKALADSPTASNLDKMKVLTAGIPAKYESFPEQAEQKTLKKVASVDIKEIDEAFSEISQENAEYVAKAMEIAEQKVAPEALQPTLDSNGWNFNVDLIHNIQWCVQQKGEDVSMEVVDAVLCSLYDLDFTITRK